MSQFYKTKKINSEEDLPKEEGVYFTPSKKDHLINSVAEFHKYGKFTGKWTRDMKGEER